MGRQAATLSKLCPQKNISRRKQPGWTVVLWMHGTFAATQTRPLVCLRRKMTVKQQAGCACGWSEEHISHEGKQGFLLRFQTNQQHIVEFVHQARRKLLMQKVHQESNSIWNSIDYANSHGVEGTTGLEWERVWISIQFIIWNQGSRCDFNYTRGVSDSLSLLANIIYAGDGSPYLGSPRWLSFNKAIYYHALSPLLLFIYLFVSIWGDLKHTAHQKQTCTSVQCAQAVKNHSWEDLYFAFFFGGGGQPFPTANNYSFNKNPLKSEMTYINF